MKKLINWREVSIPFQYLSWKGWTASVGSLYRNGWDIQLFYETAIKRYKMQFRDTTTKLIFTIEMTELEWNKALILNLQEPIQIPEIYPEHNGRTTPPLKLRREHVFTIDDVPELLEFANELLAPIRKKQIQETELPNADIFDITNKLQYNTNN